MEEDQLDGKIHEEVLVQQVAKRPILVPEFTDNGDCRIDTHWDVSDLDSNVVALAGGRPAFEQNLDDTLSDSNIDVEEQIECQVLASETYSAPSGFDDEIEEEPLLQVRIDRTAPLIESQKILESLDEFLSNSNGPILIADEPELSEPMICLEASQVAFAAPPGFQSECDVDAPDICQRNKQLNNNLEFPNSSIKFNENTDIQDIDAPPINEEPMIEPEESYSVHSPPDRPIRDRSGMPSEVKDYVSGVVDRAIIVAMNFDEEEHEENASLAKEKVQKPVDNTVPAEEIGVEEEPLIEVTRARPAESIPSGFFGNIEDQPDVVEVELVSPKIDRFKITKRVSTASDEDETEGKLNHPQLVPSLVDFDNDQSRVEEELVVEVKVPPKKLDENLFSFGNSETVPKDPDSESPGQLVEEEIIQPIAEQKAEAVPKSAKKKKVPTATLR